ncbi:hypothetical protein ISG33_08625 [Glaciecola sp. MH2013]|uniref:hypothetical protein n=1 Tax=Glaciecola sp. MH2013 TaxID=2785524 RepID=UPI00189D86AA|nr:hypothetical protein [Glaciecola sp. MH2013]MBF7073457.1 hypothetical protein [Glaciecola sp. MH2013]
MNRIKLALIIGGAILAFFGFQELRLGSIAKTAPSTISLYDLENGAAIENAHVKLTEHDAIYGGLVYSYKQKKRSSEEVSGSTEVTETYYAILSPEHPFIQAIDALQLQYPDGIPDDIEFPSLTGIKAIVKTDRFKNVAALPEGIQREQSVQGVIINEIESLGSEEAELMRQSFPGADLANVLLIEEGRTPTGTLNAIAMMGGGVLLSALGLFWFVSDRKKKRAQQHPSA